jgi:carbonic anhydrase
VDRLVKGIHQFQTTHISANRELYANLSKGQQPDTLMITCSDSRIMPGMLTQSKPGELFVLRNAGNLVPPLSNGSSGEAATIEYAVNALGVAHIVVMGHTHCGAMKGLIHPEDLTSLPLVSDWLKHAGKTRAILDEHYEDCEGEELLNLAIRENIFVQLDNLCTYPAVAEALNAGRLTLHGWIYRIEDGHVLAYDPGISRFVQIDTNQALTGINQKTSVTADIRSRRAAMHADRAA